MNYKETPHNKDKPKELELLCPNGRMVWLEIKRVFTCQHWMNLTKYSRAVES